MPPFARRRACVGMLVALLGAAILAACDGNPLSRKYEYEEEVYLNLDGSATVYVNASVPAMVVLRGMPLPLDSRARLDRQGVRALYESAVSQVASVSTSRRDNRRYVHLRIEVPDIRRLSEAPAFAWSTYRLDQRDGVYQYRQLVGPSAHGDVGDVGWTGRELVALRLHLPSRVSFHNAPSRTIERGNIISWEQPLADRVKGVPLDLQVHLETASILAHTLSLFGLMVVMVAATFVAFIWFVRRQAPAPEA